MTTVPQVVEFACWDLKKKEAIVGKASLAR
jgi:hypothetical protein